MKTMLIACIVASMTSATTAVFICAAILDGNPGVTVVDVGALLIAGILAGVFLGLCLRFGMPSAQLPTTESR